MADLRRHLQIILAGLAPGRTDLPMDRKDPAVAETLVAMAALGANVQDDGERTTVHGTGNGCLLQAEAPIVFTAMEPALMVAGLVASYDMPTTIVLPPQVGRDAVATLVAALRAMACQITIEEVAALRLHLHGAPSANPAVHDASGWSEAVAAAVMLAALNTPGQTTVCGLPSDATKLFAAFDAFGIAIRSQGDGANRTLAIDGQAELIAPQDLVAP